MAGRGVCVMKIWGAGKGFTRYAHMITHNMNTRRWFADTFSFFSFWCVIG